MKNLYFLVLKQIFFVKSILLTLVFIGLIGFQVWAETITWVGANGTSGERWDTESNWSPSNVPTSSDDVIINLVTGQTSSPKIGTDALCKTLTINTGGVLTINTGGSLTVSGNWTNNGTFTQNAGTVVFFGTSTSSISGSSATTFKELAVDMGNSISTILNVNGPGAIGVSGTLTLTNGLISVNSGASLSVSGATAIPATGGIWVNGGNFTKPSAGITNKGVFTVSSGTATIGTTSTAYSIINSTGNTFTLSGGTLNISGRLENTTGTANITGGTLKLATIGNTTTTKASFEMSTGTNLTISGSPTIIFQNANSSTVGDLKLNSGTGSKNISGGTFQFGNELTPANSVFQLNSVTSLANIVVNSTNSPTLKLASDISVSGTLTVNSGAVLTPLNDVIVGGSGTLTGTGTIQVTRTTTGSANLESQYTIANKTLNNLKIQYIGSGDQLISSMNCNNLSTSGSGNKTIAAGTSVTVNGNLSTNDDLEIISDGTNSGSLIVTGSSTGDITYKRWFKHEGETYSRWYITSAPVNVASGFSTLNEAKIHKDISLNPNEYDFATYTEANNVGWNYFNTTTNPLPESLIPGQGYLISVDPTTATDGIITFKGTLNGSPTVAVTSSENNGWNAVGNPYTSAIRVVGEVNSGSFLDVNKGFLTPEFAAVYVWNETDVYTEAGDQQYYRVIGNSGYTPPGGSSSALTDVVNIQVGQGFLINSKVDDDVIFNTGMQISDPTLSLKSAETSWPGITLLAESNGGSRNTAVAFNENMTAGLDVSYDAGLLSSSEFQVYSHLVGGDSKVDFAIQCLPDNQYSQLSIPIGVDLPEGGELLFKTSGVILPDGMFPVLEDKLLNIKTPIKSEEDSYSVTLAPNTSGIGRFYLSVAELALSNQELTNKTKVSASFLNNRISINGATEPGTKAILFDLSGRKIGEYAMDDRSRNEITVPGLSQRIYILKIEAKKTTQVIKLIALKN